MSEVDSLRNDVKRIKNQLDAFQSQAIQKFKKGRIEREALQARIEELEKRTRPQKRGSR